VNANAKNPRGVQKKNKKNKGQKKIPEKKYRRVEEVNGRKI
jgi:hypothetical protein